jgi:hypothetical protein
MEPSRQPRSCLPSLLAALVCCAYPAFTPRAAAAVEANDTARIAVEQFVQRTRDYVRLRSHVAPGARLEETASPEEISAREAALAHAIRAVRAGAKPGDVFGSAREPLAAIARRDWRERAPAERAALQGELPPSAAPAVNAPYPASLPLATVPAKLLEALPELPEELEYRFVGPHLILRDVEANLVVDVVPDLLTGTGAR